MLTSFDKLVLEYIIKDKSKYVLQNNWAQILVDAENDFEGVTDIVKAFNNIFYELAFDLKMEDTTNGHITFYYIQSKINALALLQLNSEGEIGLKPIPSKGHVLLFKSDVDANKFAIDHKLADYKIVENNSFEICYLLPYLERYHSFIFIPKY